MNNKIAELKSKEEIEIEKILQKLSFLCRTTRTGEIQN